MDSLNDRLKKYQDSNMTRMHMPGHKGNPQLVPSYYADDLTEIEGLDNLHHPVDVLRRLESDAAKIWGAKGALLSVNGATAPILAAVMSASLHGKVLVASNCHLSVWHALELSGADFKVLDPMTDPGFPFCLSIDPASVASALEEDPSIKAVIVTSPTYEGVVSDISTISEITVKHGACLIVDEAHGAHLGLNGVFPPSSQADIVIKSIHKTLHAPTQTAILLNYSDRIDMGHVRHYMDIFESSSPSYLLMSGICRVVEDLKNNPGITDNWVKSLIICREALKDRLGHLVLFDYPSVDPSKIVILTSGVISGIKLSSLLRENGIEIEAAFDTHIIAMTGIGDNESTLTKLKDILIKIDSGLTGSVDRNYVNPFPVRDSSLSMPMKDAVLSPAVTIPKEDSVGMVSAQYAFKYPPGIPVILPGQVITEDILPFIPDKTIKVVRG